MEIPRVVVVHETGGRKYFEALARTGAEPAFFEAHVARLFLSSVLRHRRPVVGALKQAIRNFRFRLTVPLVSGCVIVLGIAPWDIRLVWYRLLARRNRIVYHTSWPYWQNGHVPRDYGPLNPVLRRIWRRFLQRPNVSIVAVLPAVAGSVSSFADRMASVIPHTISPEFFAPSRDDASGPFGVLFVGALLPSKGVGLLPQITKRLPDGAFFGIVGEGPERGEIERIAATDVRIRFYGFVSDRKAQAEILSRHHILIVPSLRTRRWEELFGMVILEAMASGLAVIASNHVGPRSIITDGADGFLVPEGDIDAIAARIAALDADRSRWKEISERARRTAAGYSVEAVGAKWKAALRMAAS